MSRPTISPPASCTRFTIAASFSFESSDCSGMPFTLESRGSGTIVSPWPPSTSATTSCTATPSSCATKKRKRAESSTPAMPTTRSFGKPVSSFIA